MDDFEQALRGVEVGKMWKCDKNIVIEPLEPRTVDLHDDLINYSSEAEKAVQESERGFDQSAKADAGKIKPTLVPRQIIRDIAIVRGYGNKKYGSSDNWKGVGIERYRDALCRHLLAYLDDPKGVDEESGIPHYKHMATNMAFICEMEKEGWEDELRKYKECAVKAKTNEGK